jgi:hypothetical protein
VVGGGVRGGGWDIHRVIPLAAHSQPRQGWRRPSAGSGMAQRTADRARVSRGGTARRGRRKGEEKTAGRDGRDLIEA